MKSTAPRTMPRTNHFFDTRSVMLIAAMALGGSASLHAQTKPPLQTPAAPAHSIGQSSFATGGTSQASSGHTAPTATFGPASAAFARADTNHDGKLSPQEAKVLPAIDNRFEQIDTDHDGVLSREEFDQGAKP